MSLHVPRSLHSTQTTEQYHFAIQRPEDGYSRLKRVILIGDHHQLPPVVKNMAFQKYSHLDQSLFTRFIRLGTPYVQLNAQVCKCLPQRILPAFGYCILTDVLLTRYSIVSSGYSKTLNAL